MTTLKEYGIAIFNGTIDPTDAEVFAKVSEAVASEGPEFWAANAWRIEDTDWLLVLRDLENCTALKLGKCAQDAMKSRLADHEAETREAQKMANNARPAARMWESDRDWRFDND